MPVATKICGLMTTKAVETAIEGGAAMCGFVFFPPSPRNLAVEEAAGLTSLVPEGVAPVALTVDADDSLLHAITEEAGVGMLQLHGHETPEQTARISDKFGLAVMKVLPIANAADVVAARAYEGVCDRLMFDAKPPKDATRPGGNALAFDWELLSGHDWAVPWALAGGLTAENVAEAVRISGAQMVDVSSGVEDAPGIKSPAKIRAFLNAVKAL